MKESKLFQSESYQLSLSGSYNSLHQFLVELESLQTAVLVSDLELSSAADFDSESAKPPISSKSNLALRMRLIVLKRVQEVATEDQS